MGLLLVGGVGAGVLFAMISSGAGPFPDPEGCEAQASGRKVWVDLEQAENAAIIAGEAIRRGLPARAVTIALATAYQESKIRNLDYGDRDSLGLFQQRPSQGWGTKQQVRDPHYASGRFYDDLVEVDGYETMEITKAAQEVQRSAYADAYAGHEQDARVLASALTGYSRSAFTCTIRPVDDDAQRLRPNGLTSRANGVRRDLAATFDGLQLGGFAPGGVRNGHSAGSAHYDGRAIDIFFRPVNPDNSRRGWALAHYLVARADRLGIATVIFDDRIWTARRSSQGWREYDEPSGGDPQILQHRDHVHVDVR
ncbi:MAG: hypothetical protein GEU93_01365 [Propionibacteriales bacterium]|nr:hypothetical protein [Propionibacteriales bacterium]